MKLPRSAKFWIPAAIIIFSLLFWYRVYTLWQASRNFEEARSRADYIIEHFTDPTVLEYFPPENFDNDKVIEIQQIMDNCRWGLRRGGFEGARLQWAIFGKSLGYFVYEYSLACGNFRFTLVFELEGKPRLRSVHVEEI